MSQFVCFMVHGICADVETVLPPSFQLPHIIKEKCEKSWGMSDNFCFKIEHLSLKNSKDKLPFFYNNIKISNIYSVQNIENQKPKFWQGLPF